MNDILLVGDGLPLEHERRRSSSMDEAESGAQSDAQPAVAAPTPANAIDATDDINTNAADILVGARLLGMLEDIDPPAMHGFVVSPFLGWILGVGAALASMIFLNDYPCEAEASGWRAGVISSLSPLGVSEKVLRRFIGVTIPSPPPFGRVFIEYWLPQLSFLPGHATRTPTANYHYVCTDVKYQDYSYHYTYDASHERFFTDSLRSLLHIVLFEIFLWVVTYAMALLVLNWNLRNSLSRLYLVYADRLRNIFRKPVCPRHIDEDTICALCYEPLLARVDSSATETPNTHHFVRHIIDRLLDWLKWRDPDDSRLSNSSFLSTEKGKGELRSAQPLTYCKWGCGNVVHEFCMGRWLKYKNRCVICSCTWR